jgi:hypothetical protein
VSLDRCLPDLVKDGKLSREQAEEASNLFGELKRNYQRQFGDQTAEAMASRETVDALAIEAAEKRRSELLQVQSQKSILVNSSKFADGKGRLGAAMMAFLDQDERAPYMNVSYLTSIVRGDAHRMIEGILDKFERNLIGNMRNPAEMEDVISEIFGKSTGNAAAKEMAEAWKQTAEMLRQRYNAAGGKVGKLEYGYMPQSHDLQRVLEAGYTKWRDTIAPLLDRDKMIDYRTGKPMSDIALETGLNSAYNNIVTDGWIGRDPGGQGGSKLANGRAEHRFLHFKDGEAWMKYRESFGNGASPFDAMIGHIDGLANDIAHMEVLGPNPNATIGWMQDMITKEAALRGEKAGMFKKGASGEVYQIGKLYDVTTGRSSIPVNAAWARNMAGFRAYLSAAKLGSAIFSSLDDVGKQAITRAYNGLPIAGAISSYAHTFSADQAHVAVRLGLIAGEAGKMGAAVNRYTGESMGPGIASRMADGVMRVQGLGAWTQAGKWAYGMQTLGHYADEIKVPFGELTPKNRAALERYGIGEADWDHIRATPLFEHEGATFIDPSAIENRKISDKFMQMVLTETNFAVPEIGNRARAMTTFGRPGTLAGEAGRSIIQFKGFSVHTILTHGRRMTMSNPWDRAGYAAAFAGSSMLLGALAIQAKELVKGLSPMPMDDPKFWARAELQGGGLGIFGDFMSTAAQQALSSGTGSQRAGSLGEAIVGPTVGAAADAARFGLSFVERSGKPGRVGAQMLRAYTPGSNLWYTRAAFDRLVIDNVSRWVDPDYDKHFDMMEASAASRGQSYAWRPGMAKPDGSPDFSHSFDKPPEPPPSE